MPIFHNTRELNDFIKEGTAKKGNIERIYSSDAFLTDLKRSHQEFYINGTLIDPILQKARIKHLAVQMIQKAVTKINQYPDKIEDVVQLFASEPELITGKFETELLYISKLLELESSPLLVRFHNFCKIRSLMLPLLTNKDYLSLFKKRNRDYLITEGSKEELDQIRDDLISNAHEEMMDKINNDLIKKTPKEEFDQNIDNAIKKALEEELDQIKIEKGYEKELDQIKNDLISNAHEEVLERIKDDLILEAHKEVLDQIKDALINKAHKEVWDQINDDLIKKTPKKELNKFIEGLIKKVLEEESGQFTIEKHEKELDQIRDDLISKAHKEVWNRFKDNLFRKTYKEALKRINHDLIRKSHQKQLEQVEDALLSMVLPEITKIENQCFDKAADEIFDLLFKQQNGEFINKDQTKFLKLFLHQNALYPNISLLNKLGDGDYLFVNPDKRNVKLSYTNEGLLLQESFLIKKVIQNDPYEILEAKDKDFLVKGVANYKINMNHFKEGRWIAKYNLIDSTLECDEKFKAMLDTRTILEKFQEFIETFLNTILAFLDVNRSISPYKSKCEPVFFVSNTGSSVSEVITSDNMNFKEISSTFP